jgi:hypothetical protein
MQNTFHSALVAAKKQWIKDGIMTPVFNGLAQAGCTVAHHEPLDPTYTLDCTETWQEYADQRTLGSEAILCGFHHVNWVYLLQNTWVPPTAKWNKRAAK